MCEFQRFCDDNDFGGSSSGDCNEERALAWVTRARMVARIIVDIILLSKLCPLEQTEKGEGRHMETLMLPVGLYTPARQCECLYTGILNWMRQTMAVVRQAECSHVFTRVSLPAVIDCWMTKFGPLSPFRVS